MPARRVEVKGLRELGANIKALKLDTRMKIAPAMTGAGANVVKKAAISNAPQSDEQHALEGIKIQPGNLKKNVIVVKVRKPGDLTAESIVTVRGGEKGKYASRYGSMKEHGTVKMPKQPWLLPALDENITPAINAMAERGKKRVADAVKKLKKTSR